MNEVKVGNEMDSILGLFNQGYKVDEEMNLEVDENTADILLDNIESSIDNLNDNKKLYINKNFILGGL